MKKTLILLFVCMLCMPLYAQLKLGPKARRIRSGRLLQPRVSTLSRMTNNALWRQTRQISLTSTFPADGSLKKGHLKPGHIERSTFQLHQTDGPLAPAASGFAIDLFGDGVVKGVTAGHLMRDISKRNRDPHIRVQTGPDSFIIAPINKESITIGNPDGIDIALFDIPKETLPYINVLHPAEHAPILGQEVTIQGYLEKYHRVHPLALSNAKREVSPQGQEVTFPRHLEEYEQAHPFTLARQKVLFSTPFQTFIEKNPKEENLRGFCGSPIFANDLVSMIYLGFKDVKTLKEQGWLNGNTHFPLAEMHHAIPIDVVKQMAKSVKETGSAKQGGIMMKALGRPVALMHFNEAIASIEQFRDGKQIAKIDKNFPIDPYQLELFFDLQENDVLRVSLNSFSIDHPKPTIDTIYDVNVSTGEVTKVLGEDPL